VVSRSVTELSAVNLGLSRSQLALAALVETELRAALLVADTVGSGAPAATSLAPLLLDVILTSQDGVLLEGAVPSAALVRLQTNHDGDSDEKGSEGNNGRSGIAHESHLSISLDDARASAIKLASLLLTQASLGVGIESLGAVQCAVSRVGLSAGELVGSHGGESTWSGSLVRAGGKTTGVMRDGAAGKGLDRGGSNARGQHGEKSLCSFFRLLLVFVQVVDDVDY